MENIHIIFNYHEAPLEHCSVVKLVNGEASQILLRRGVCCKTMAPAFASPITGINYNFVAGAYLICSVILGVLLVLDKVGL